MIPKQCRRKGHRMEARFIWFFGSFGPVGGVQQKTRGAEYVSQCVRRGCSFESKIDTGPPPSEREESR